MHRFFLILSFVAVGIVAMPANASAQSNVLVLLTQVDIGEDGSSSESFWWSGSSAPEWTDVDEAIRGMEPTGLERISRIYRRPNLSDANAAALAELFGASSALVGEVRRERLAVSPLGDAAVRVSVNARLVQPGADGVNIKQTYTLDRLSKGDPNAARLQATTEVGQALSGLVRATLERKVGPVGVAGDELNVSFYGVPNLEAWRGIRTRLGQRDGVEDIRVTWMAEGIITVALNAETSETDDTVKRIVRDLQNEVFETFSIVAAPEKSNSGTVAVRVRPLTN